MINKKDVFNIVASMDKKDILLSVLCILMIPCIGAILYLFRKTTAQEDQLKAQEDQLKAQEDQLKAQEDQLKAQEDQLKAQEDKLKAQDYSWVKISPEDSRVVKVTKSDDGMKITLEEIGVIDLTEVKEVELTQLSPTQAYFVHRNKHFPVKTLDLSVS